MRFFAPVCRTTEGEFSTRTATITAVGITEEDDIIMIGITMMIDRMMGGAGIQEVNVLTIVPKVGWGWCQHGSLLDAVHISLS